ncbi:uncharacterized protein LOC135387677 [Ornithodoros turicata]|uniref:uncharacterized protein LOC135387677 n=1 Tax=Ornithodoros turicata TaxID=34597 RepID=UPI003139FCF5
MLDVYPIDSLQDVDLGLSILHDPSYVDEAKGRTFLVKWSEDSEPSEAFIVAAGTSHELERKRSKLLKALELVGDICGVRESEAAACTDCAENKRKIEELEHANARLMKKLRRAKEKCAMSNMVDHMESIIQTASTQNNAVVNTAPKVDIGLGVCLDAGVLHRIERSSKGDGTRLARSLMRAVFLPEEMVGRTLYGRPCNAHKGAPVKPAVEETRREAVLVSSLQFGLLDWHSCAAPLAATSVCSRATHLSKWAR